VDLCGHATLASAYVVMNFLEPAKRKDRFSLKGHGSSYGQEERRTPGT
jgi:predicted PhzF superfamily epimerase YddE/YHI9